MIRRTYSPSETSSKKLLGRPDALLADRDDQAKIAGSADDLVLDPPSAASPCSRSILSSTAALHLAGSSVLRRNWLCLVLEIIHLEEKVPLLLSREQRDIVQAGEVGRQVIRRTAAAVAVAGIRRGKRSEDFGNPRGLGEARVVHELELELQDSLRPDLVDDLHHLLLAEPGLGGKDLNRQAPARLAKDLCLGRLVEPRAAWCARRDPGPPSLPPDPWVASLPGSFPGLQLPFPDPLDGGMSRVALNYPCPALIYDRGRPRLIRPPPQIEHYNYGSDPIPAFSRASLRQ